MSEPKEVALPEQSKIQAIASGASFYDAWEMPTTNPDLAPLEQFLRVMKQTPKWFDRLMVLRNRVVSLFGLKDLGAFSEMDESKPSSDYKTGDRVGIFTLIENDQNEVLLGDDDNHLSVVVSIHKKTDASTGSTFITVSTVVHVKNWLGRLYMIPVAPAHKIIAKRMTKSIGI
ncbi:MAG: DUF2867 domain-containing protein [Marinomonas sp.]